MSALRVVVVEDSLVQRAHLIRTLELEGDLEVVAEAADADAAVAAVAAHAPDVVTMDLELPGGGHNAIRRIMDATPTPILVLSGIIAGIETAAAVEALAGGAVDALPKPLRWTAAEEGELRATVRAVACANFDVGDDAAAVETSQPETGRAHIVALVASTGGPAALTAVLRGLRDVDAPLLIVQHIHQAFMAGFVSWLENAAGRAVEVARDGELPQPGSVYVAPVDAHLRVDASGAFRVDDANGAATPSADILLRSLAEHVGSGAVGVVLSGMGDDGAKGLLALKQAGGRAFAQDEASSTVFEMPRAARDAGAVEDLLPPERLASAVAAAVGPRE